MFNITVRRGDIFYVDFGKDVVGSEQGGRRPVVVIQNRKGNMYSPTVIVAVITSKINKTKLPTHVEISSDCGLLKQSTILLEQIKTIDKSRLGKYIGRLEKEDMRALDKACKISTGTYTFLDYLFDNLNNLKDDNIGIFKRALYNLNKKFNNRNNNLCFN